MRSFFFTAVGMDIEGSHDYRYFSISGPGFPTLLQLEEYAIGQGMIEPKIVGISEFAQADIDILLSSE